MKTRYRIILAMTLAVLIQGCQEQNRETTAGKSGYYEARQKAADTAAKVEKIRKDAEKDGF